MPPCQKQDIVDLLDKQADTNGFSKSSDGEDWTDVKHSERKKRDRVLADGVLFKLMKKSDLEGFKRLVINLSILGLTSLGVAKMLPTLGESPIATAAFAMLYVFYGFQFQAFAFAGQHEFLHRNAFRTKVYNDICLFCTSVFCFEFGEHERVMHKQHHTFTNNIDKDPELSSFYSRETLLNPAFRNVATSRWSYFMQFWDISYPFYCRMGRLFNSACGIPVDYSGWGWNTPTWQFSKDIQMKLQRMALLQLFSYAVILWQFWDRLDRLLIFWVVPVFVGYPAVNYFRNLEHADCEITQEQPNSLRNTRSVKSNPLIRLLLWETNFHAEHHCYCMVPFYNLPKLNDLMAEHVIHNECEHFTSQNWECVRPGGWIDQQTKGMNKAKAL